MNQLKLSTEDPENNVPQTTKHTGKIIDLGHTKWIVRTASDMEMANNCAVHASVTGSTGGRDFVNEVWTGPGCDKIERWAIVDRVEPPVP